MQHLAHHAIDAEANTESVFVGFDVDVGRVFLDRFRQYRVNEADDRCVIVAFEQVRGFLELLRDGGKVKFLVEPIDHLRGLGVVLPIEGLQQRIEFLGGNPPQLQRDTRKPPCLGQRNWRSAAPINRGTAIGAEIADHDAMTSRKRK